MRELRKRAEQLLERLKDEPKQKWIVLLLLSGVGLCLVSSFIPKEEEAQTVQSQTAVIEQEPQLQQQLEQCLKRVSGVGKVEVLLSLAQEQSTVYQMDENTSSSETGRSEQRNTVIVSGEGLVQTVYAPVYRGAVVVCEGGDRASVVQAVKAAVSSLTGLKSDQIIVMKMSK